MNAAVAVTPLVLTYNEEPNIGRTLESLRWAHRVVVLDSGSTDRTGQIARGFPNVSWHSRPFDRHAAQWRYGIESTGITTDFVLALDADHQVPAAFVHEMEAAFLSGAFDAGTAAFDYRFYGESLGGSLYPPKIVVFRRSALEIAQPGHTQEFRTTGRTYRFTVPLVHDDRKPLDRFVASQLKYSILEADRLTEGRSLRWSDRVRRTGLMPPLATLFAFVRAGGPFRGIGALRYAYERATFECLLALRILNRRCEERADTAGTAPAPAGMDEPTARARPVR